MPSLDLSSAPSRISLCLLERLEGSIQAIEYCAFGKLPGDGNHDGMKDHKPVKHGNLDLLD